MLNPINTYTGGGVRPCMDVESGLTDAVNLPASKYLPQGTVLGQVVGSGTAVAEVQTLTITGTPTGGTFILQYDGEYTSAIAYNATAADVQAALEALPSIGTGGVTGGGGGLPGTAVTITFAGSLAGLAQPLITVVASLTGGTNPAAAVARTTAGKPAGGYWDAYDDSASGSFAGLATARRILQYNSRTDSQGRIYASTTKQGSDNAFFQRSTPAWIAGTFRGSDLTGLDANGVTDLGRLIAGNTSTLTAATTLLRIG